MKIQRQGDVLFVSVRSVPAGAVSRLAAAGRHVLVEGEATGHAHAVLDAECEVLVGADGRVFARPRGDEALVRHEEHAPIALRGPVEVRRQVEFDAGEARRVAD